MSDPSPALGPKTKQALTYDFMPLSPLCSICRFAFEQHDSLLLENLEECISTPEGQTFERFLKAVKDECFICYRVWNYDRSRAEEWESFGAAKWCPLTYSYFVPFEEKGVITGLRMQVHQQSAAAVLWDVDDAPSFVLADTKGKPKPLIFGAHMLIKTRIIIPPSAGGRSH